MAQLLETHAVRDPQRRGQVDGEHPLDEEDRTRNRIVDVHDTVQHEEADAAGRDRETEPHDIARAHEAPPARTDPETDRAREADREQQGKRGVENARVEGAPVELETQQESGVVRGRRDRHVRRQRDPAAVRPGQLKLRPSE